ncbi:uncharacterized protein [Venturia canescens]|uniref:uncharacterized protein n=1 Tax=Venturia canescens TaxID=32260 RepID=UPI001C9D42F4|nr:uncharacterized protein LOC122418409 [Venturia canescens]
MANISSSLGVSLFRDGKIGKRTIHARNTKTGSFQALFNRLKNHEAAKFQIWKYFLIENLFHSSNISALLTPVSFLRPKLKFQYSSTLVTFKSEGNISLQSSQHSNTNSSCSAMGIFGSRQNELGLWNERSHALSQFSTKTLTDLSPRLSLNHGPVF